MAVLVSSIYRDCFQLLGGWTLVLFLVNTGLFENFERLEKNVSLFYQKHKEVQNGFLYEFITYFAR